MPSNVLIVFADPVLFPAAMPYGAMIVKDVLCSIGIEADIIFPFMHSNPTNYLSNEIQRIGPCIIGFSFRNLDSAGFHYNSDGEQHYLDSLIELVRIAKKYKTFTVLGGSGFSIAPNEVLNSTGADIGFIGPAENDFSVFCRRIINEKKDILSAIADLQSAVLPRQNPIKGPLLQRKIHKIRKLDSIGIEYARMVGGAIPVRTKTGCTFRCAYCVVPQIEPLILRNWGDIFDELVLIKKNELDDRVFIADGEFNVPSIDRAIDVCRQWYRDFSDSIKWRCYLTEKFINQQLLKSMKKAGCVGISVTVDSLADQPRNGLLKECDTKTTLDAIQICLDSEIETCVNLIFGGPEETVETTIETAQRAVELNKKGIQINVTVGLRYYPNTPLYDIALQKKYLKYAKRSQSLNWMGTFCSPMPAPVLANYILEILKPSETVYYTHSLSQEKKELYKNIAIGTSLLLEKRFREAEIHFNNLLNQYPGQLEPLLGKNKAVAGLIKNMGQGDNPIISCQE